MMKFSATRSFVCGGMESCTFLSIDEIRSVILRARETLRIWTGISSIVKAVACNLDPVIRFLMNLTAERRKRTSEKQQNL